MTTQCGAALDLSACSVCGLVSLTREESMEERVKRSKVRRREEREFGHSTFHLAVIYRSPPLKLYEYAMYVRMCRFTVPCHFPMPAACAQCERRSQHPTAQFPPKHSPCPALPATTTTTMTTAELAPARYYTPNTPSTHAVLTAPDSTAALLHAHHAHHERQVVCPHIAAAGRLRMILRGRS